LDNCESTYPGNGTVWVNYTVTNYGDRGRVVVWAKVYQGIENYQYCGNGTIYNESQWQEYELNNDESAHVSFIFTGINCATGTGCYGCEYWIDLNIH